jgi:1-deoxy-D-xylulose-5-phosphate synthase
LGKYLDRINSPQDIRALTVAQLNYLAEEIREKIIATVAQNGGHLAPNLGVVELTLALHRIFRTPRDKIIWDVGHQSYVHKLITGRREQFDTLRRYGGLSGFPARMKASTTRLPPGIAVLQFLPPWVWPWQEILKVKNIPWWL